MTFPTPALTWPRIALLTIGDGRDDLLDATLASLGDQLGASLEHIARARVAELDATSGRDGRAVQTLPYREASLTRGGPIGPFVAYCHVDDRRHELGFGGAIAAGWRGLLDTPGFDYVLHVEEDWRFDAAVDLKGMAMLLDFQPHLAQVALKRQPVSPIEKHAGGLVELWPDEYADRFLDVGELEATDEAGSRQPHERVAVETRRLHWLEHGLFFTTNPSMYRRDLMHAGWPSGSNSERAFTRELRARGRAFAFMGRRGDPPAVWHTGDERRAGRGY